MAGSFAPTPSVDGVGPGALANPSLFLAQLSEAGLRVHVEKDITRFHFADFDSAWNALAGVTTADLEQAVQDRARSAVRERMWSAGNGPREFRNETQFIIANRIR